MQNWKDFLPLLPGFVGAIIGGLLALAGTFLTSYFNRKNLLRQFQHQISEEKRLNYRNKLEQLFKILTQYQADVHRFFNYIHQVGSVDPVEEKEFFALLSKLDAPFAEISYLIKMYFPELKKELGKLSNARTELLYDASLVFKPNLPINLPPEKLNGKINTLIQQIIKMGNDAESLSQKYTGITISEPGNNTTNSSLAKKHSADEE